MVIHAQSAFGSAAFTGLINSIWHFNCSWFGYLKVFNSNFLHFFSPLFSLPKWVEAWMFYFYLSEDCWEWNVEPITWFSNIHVKNQSIHCILHQKLHPCTGYPSIKKKIKIATSVITYVTNANVWQCMFDFLNYWIHTLKDAYAVNLDWNFFRMRQYVRLASWIGSKQNCTSSVMLWC